MRRTVRSIGMLAAVTVSALFASVGAPVAAQVDADAAARAAFETGREAFGEGRFEEALESFEQAYELSARPELLFNIGQSHDRLRHDAEAVDAFERYLAATPGDINRQAVETRIRLIRESMAEREAEQAVAPVAAVEEEDSGSTWWIWLIVGGVAVAAGVTVAIIAANPTVELQEPIPGDGGRVLMGLSW